MQASGPKFTKRRKRKQPQDKMIIKPIQPGYKNTKMIRAMYHSIKLKIEKDKIYKKKLIAEIEELERMQNMFKRFDNMGMLETTREISDISESDDDVDSGDEAGQSGYENSYISDISDIENYENRKHNIKF